MLNAAFLCIVKLSFSSMNLYTGFFNSHNIFTLAIFDIYIHIYIYIVLARKSCKKIDLIPKFKLRFNESDLSFFKVLKLVSFLIFVGNSLKTMAPW